MFRNVHDYNWSSDKWTDSVWVLEKHIPIMQEVIKNRSLIDKVERTKIQETVYGTGCYYILTFSSNTARNLVASKYNYLLDEAIFKETYSK